MSSNPIGAIPIPNLRKWRFWAGLSQEELATAARVKKLTILEIENGRAARFSTIGRIAEALEISRKELIHAMPEPDRVA
jgi:predicted transcriptional regulator